MTSNRLEYARTYLASRGLVVSGTRWILATLDRGDPDMGTDPMASTGGPLAFPLGKESSAFSSSALARCF
jgi:hypothetical protein